MDTRFLIFMKPRLRVAALARPVGAEENARGSRNKTQKKRGHLQYEIFTTPVCPPDSSRISVPSQSLIVRAFGAQSLFGEVENHRSMGTSPTGAVLVLSPPVNCYTPSAESV